MHAQLLQSYPTVCDPMDCSSPGSSVHEIFPGKDTRVCCHFFFQEIFLTWGSNQRLLRLIHCRQILTTEPPGKPFILLLLSPKDYLSLTFMLIPKQKSLDPLIV